MKNYPANKIRNICIIGHGKAGKTTLCEGMLFCAGATDRFGNVADGTTVTDYDPEEIKRGFSISTAVAPLEWKESKINLIDTPGYFDFVGGVAEGLRGCDSVLVVVSGKNGVEVGTEHAFGYAAEKKLPVMAFVNELDDEHADFNNVVSDLKDKFGNAVIPFVLPIKDGDKLVGFVDIVKNKAYEFDGFKAKDAAVPGDMADAVAQVREELTELVAETDEELMEKYFDGQEFTEDEYYRGIRAGIKDKDIIPVLAGELIKGAGVSLLLDGIVEYMPSPEDIGAVEAKDAAADQAIELQPKDTEPLAAVVFKTVADPYVGKLSIFRVVSGVLKADSTVYNSIKDTNEKIGHVYFLRGKKQIETDSVGAGDIGAVTKLNATTTGDTLCEAGKRIVLSGVEYPKPVISMAIVPLAKGDEDKISSGLTRLTEEDPTFKVSNNVETRQLLIEGQGEQHLDVITSKLKAKYGVSVELTQPLVPYRETIKGKSRVEGKHKKQTGGHGQYGHVWIEFEPGTEEGLEFAESVFGGAVPRNYFPAVEKGLRECMEHGVLAGYPVVNLKATLVDGSYHPVDSSEMAFKIAASIAFKNGLTQANPVLLEPIGYLKVNVPDSMMGDVIGDINKRRGRIIGMGSGTVEAEVPMAEMFKYTTDLRSMTQGRGSFSFEFVRYEEVPANIAQKVIEEAKARAEAEK